MDISPYWQGEVEFLGATESDNTGRTLRLKMVRSGRDLLLANPFLKATRKRKGHAGTRFQLSLAPIEPQPEKYAGEALLLNWSDGPKGSTVTMLLDCEDTVHPFMGCRRGSAFMGVWVELDEDETVSVQEPVSPVVETSLPSEEPPEPEAHKRQHRAQPYSVQAALLLKNEDFRRWLIGSKVAVDIEVADRRLKTILDLNSKSDLDKDSKLAAAFIGLRSQFLNR